MWQLALAGSGWVSSTRPEMARYGSIRGVTMNYRARLRLGLFPTSYFYHFAAKS
jgi:hypothetical protein